jgi:hypothetical protein
MSHGLKSLAQELPQYGRMGDTMVAHINPQEAALLKSLGGSGTINPHTGLPEFGMFGIGGGGGILGTGINKNANDPLSNALSNNPVSQGVSKGFQGAMGAVDQGLVGLDKTVGKAIPGGWGTVAAIAGSAMGLPTSAMIGLGALNGSGVMHKGGKFNLQGAIMGGAMAYGMSELGEYARAADGVPTVDSAGNLTTPPTAGATPPTGSIEEALPSNYGSAEPTGYVAGQNGTMQPTFDASAPIVEPPAAVPTASAPYESPPFDPNYDPNAGIRQPIMDSLSRGDVGDALKTAKSDVGSYLKDAYGSAEKGLTNFKDAALSKDTYTNAWDNAGTKLSEYGTNVKETGSGIGKILTGNADPAAAAAVKAGTIMSPLAATGLTAFGTMSLADMDAQRQYLKDQAAAGAISNAQYQQELADIERQADIARKNVSSNPLHSSSDLNNVSVGSSLYDRKNSEDNLYARNSSSGSRLYAAGGAVSPVVANPPDDQTRTPNQSPIQQIGSPDSSSGLQAMFGRLRGLGLGDSQPQPAMQTFTPPWEPDFQAVQPQFQQPQRYPQVDQTYKGGFPSQLDEGAGNGSSMGSQLGGFGGLGGGSQGAFPLQGQYGIVKMAAGGMAPRFLSGGGDGMSDSIHASINGTQEARLADGEFVIPADVVSHLGNGSSKAGAKQLYSMMDKVRQARTGRKSQGKQINPRKFLLA